MINDDLMYKNMLENIVRLTVTTTFELFEVIYNERLVNNSQKIHCYIPFWLKLTLLDLSTLDAAKVNYS